MIKLFVIAAIVFCSTKLFAQIGLGITTPHPNAYFQINSTNKGVLLPRMTALQRLAIAPTATANGLIVFDTDSSAYMFWTGTLWRKIGGDDGYWIKSGNNIYNSNTHNVGIGTSTPLARLHVADSAVVFTGREDINFSTPDPPPVTGVGSRMMWYPQKAALVSGRLDINCTDCWDKDSIGFHALAVGFNPKAVGISSIALGAGPTARGVGSIALGIGTEARDFASFSAGYLSRAEQYASIAIGDRAVSSGAGAASIGNLTEAIGDASFATGLRTKAIGKYSFAAGNLSEARAEYSVAFGKAYANGLYSIAFGNESAASGIGSFAAGVNSIAMGDNSFAFGNNAYANGSNSFAFGDNVGAGSNSIVFGSWNDNTPGSPVRLFQVANGTSSLGQNALTILQTGAVGIGTVDPQSKLDVAGNIHAQTNLNVDGFTYTNSFQTDVGVVTNNFTVGGILQSYKGRVMDSLETRYFKLYDGYGNAGYVITSDADGNGSWQPAVNNNWVANGADIHNSNTGNVGIGNTNPTFLLDVNNRMRIRSGGSNASTAGIWLNNNANSVLTGFVGMESDNAIGFYGTGTPNGWGLVMDIATGNVGIGTSVPSQKLHVIGNILATGTITPSDIRYKTNIHPIQNSLNKLIALNGVTY